MKGLLSLNLVRLQITIANVNRYYVSFQKFANHFNDPPVILPTGTLSLLA
jgi:hypothetical protein